MKHAFRILIIVGVISVASLTVIAQQSAKKTTAKRDAISIAAVRRVLDLTRDAWNRGDIAGFMWGYARSPATTFISGDSITRGWHTVHDRYQKNYDSREKMGTLTYSEIESTVMGPEFSRRLGTLAFATQK